MYDKWEQYCAVWEKIYPNNILKIVLFSVQDNESQKLVAAKAIEV